MEVEPNFYHAYVKLLHVEAYLVGKILEPGTTMLDLVSQHNVIEDAKGRVVQAYLPAAIKCNKEKI